MVQVGSNCPEEEGRSGEGEGSGSSEFSRDGLLQFTKPTSTHRLIAGADQHLRNNYFQLCKNYTYNGKTGWIWK